MPSEALAMTHDREPRAVPRTLANVLLDIAAARQENARNHRLWTAADDRSDTADADRLSDEGAEIDNRLSELTDEAKELIHDATGCAWDQIYEALA